MQSPINWPRGNYDTSRIAPRHDALRVRARVCRGAYDATREDSIKKSCPVPFQQRDHLEHPLSLILIITPPKPVRYILMQSTPGGATGRSLLLVQVLVIVGASLSIHSLNTTQTHHSRHYREDSLLSLVPTENRARAFLRERTWHQWRRAACFWSGTTIGILFLFFSNCWNFDFRT